MDKMLGDIIGGEYFGYLSLCGLVEFNNWGFLELIVICLWYYLRL